jgi:hypothetical protein
MKLTAVFEPAKEGGYSCFIEEIPAAISQGETLAEAKANLTGRPQASVAVPAGLGGKNPLA